MHERELGWMSRFSVNNKFQSLAQIMWLRKHKNVARKSYGPLLKNFFFCHFGTWQPLGLLYVIILKGMSRIFLKMYLLKKESNRFLKIQVIPLVPLVLFGHFLLIFLIFDFKEFYLHQNDIKHGKGFDIYYVKKWTWFRKVKWSWKKYSHLYSLRSTILPISTSNLQHNLFRFMALIFMQFLKHVLENWKQKFIYF